MRIHSVFEKANAERLLEVVHVAIILSFRSRKHS